MYSSYKYCGLKCNCVLCVRVNTTFVVFCVVYLTSGSLCSENLAHGNQRRATDGEACVFDITRVYSVCKGGPEMGDPTRHYQGHIRSHASRRVHWNTHLKRNGVASELFRSQGHVRSHASRTVHRYTNSKGNGLTSGPIPLSRSYSVSCVEDSTQKHKFQR